MGGAINRVGPTDTAYAERSALWMSSIDGNWEHAADNEANVAWVRESFKQIAPYSNGTTYTNFTGQADETAGALAATAYGANMARLSLISPAPIAARGRARCARPAARPQERSDRA